MSKWLLPVFILAGLLTAVLVIVYIGCIIVSRTLIAPFTGGSELAIVALGAGYYYGLGILDPISGLVGAVVIASWSYGLIRDSAMVLLDADADPGLSDEIRGFLEKELKARIPDLHLWRLGPGHRGLIVSLISPDAISALRAVGTPFTSSASSVTMLRSTAP